MRHLVGDENYETNCYSCEQLPLMGVTGVESTQRSISGHYSIKETHLSNTFVYFSFLNSSNKTPPSSEFNILVSYLKVDNNFLYERIMDAEENWEVWNSDEQHPFSIQTLSPPLLKPNSYELPIVKMRISRAGVWKNPSWKSRLVQWVCSQKCPLQKTGQDICFGEMMTWMTLNWTSIFLNKWHLYVTANT